MTIEEYNQLQSPEMMAICKTLQQEIDRGLPDVESKIWHGGPVWFIEGNPIVGYWVRRNKQVGEYVRLMFWSGVGFTESGLHPGTGKFKDAHVEYLNESEIDADKIAVWLKESKEVQWDYKNLIKNKGELHRK